MKSAKRKIRKQGKESPKRNERVAVVGTVVVTGVATWGAEAGVGGRGASGMFPIQYKNKSILGPRFRNPDLRTWFQIGNLEQIFVRFR